MSHGIVPRCIRAHQFRISGKVIGHSGIVTADSGPSSKIGHVPPKYAHGAEQGSRALIQQARKLPRELYKSLTWDRGKEMADHQRFSLATDIKVYFCDPKSPWQRGSNENTNGLLRQYFPKGMDLSSIHQNRLNAVARQLNERPRKTLNFRTPAERFNQCVASTD